jgi:PAS domain S-box-containing protein
MSATRVRKTEQRPAAERPVSPAPTGSGKAWAWFLGAAFAGGLLYFALPDGSVAQGAVFVVAALAVPVAIAVGIVRNRPAVRAPWFLLLAAWILYQAANVPWALFPRVAGRPLPYPSAVDWLYWSSYAVIAAALFSLIRTRGRDRGGMLDALVVTAGLGILAYTFLIHPYIELHGAPVAVRAASTAYPLLDLLLVGAVATLAFTRGPRPPAFWLLCSAAVIQLLCDVGYALGLLDGTFGPGSPSHLGWIVSYGAYGAAALHPSMRRLTESSEAEPGISRTRRKVLALAALVPIGFLMAGEAREGHIDGLVGAAVAALVFLLVLVRLAGVSQSLEVTHESRERARARAEELEQIRERLRRAEERYRTLVEHVPAVVYEAETGAEGRWTYVSPQIERLLGFTPKEWMTDPELWARQIHPVDRDRTVALEEEAWERAQAHPGEGDGYDEYRMLHRDGRTIWIRDQAFVIRDGDGRPTFWRGVLHDITEAMEAAEKLARSHAQLATTLESTADAIVVVDADGRVSGHNGRYREMWDLPEDLVGWDVEEIRTRLQDRMLDPAGYIERGRWLDAQLEAEGADVLELRDGRLIERTSKPQRLGERIVGRVWSFRDVTEQRRTERMLAEAQRVGRLGSWDWNAQTGETAWSDELYRLYGAEPGGFEPTLEEWLSRIHPEDRDRVRRENEAAVERGGAMRMVFRVVLPDGQVREHTAEGEMTLDEEGRPLRMIGVEYDVTELKRAQTDLKRSLEALRETDAQRRRLLARLVEVQEEERSRIAADFHDDSIQVMTAVGMRLEALRTRLESEEDRARVQSLERNVTGAVARLRNLLFELRPRALDREGLVAALRVYLSHGGKGDGATFHVDSALLDEPPVETRVVLYRAAQEALANARKHSGASNVRIEIRQPNDGYLVRIVDDGRGFSPSDEPEPGHLGIVAMRDRVEMAGGWLRIESAEGKGTTVEFWVPGPQALQAGAGART